MRVERVEPPDALTVAVDDGQVVVLHQLLAVAQGEADVHRGLELVHPVDQDAVAVNDLLHL